jgi:hypothetical protein
LNSTQLYQSDTLTHHTQLGLFDQTKEAPAFQHCRLDATKETELEIVPVSRGYRLHWQKQPIGIVLNYDEAAMLAEELQPEINKALAKGRIIDFEDKKWRQLYTSLLEQFLEGGDA